MDRTIRVGAQETAELRSWLSHIRGRRVLHALAPKARPEACSAAGGGRWSATTSNDSSPAVTLGVTVPILDGSPMEVHVVKEKSMKGVRIPKIHF